METEKGTKSKLQTTLEAHKSDIDEAALAYLQTIDDDETRIKELERLSSDGTIKLDTFTAISEEMESAGEEPGKAGGKKEKKEPEPEKPPELRPVAHRGEAGYERLVAVVDDPDAPEDIKKIAETILNSNFQGHKEAEEEFDGFPAVKEWRAKEKAEKTAGQEKVLKDLGEAAAGELTKKDELEKALEAAGVSPEEREKMLATLQTPEAKTGLGAKISQAFKKYIPNGWQEFLVGFGAGYGTKLAIRSVITAVYGSSLGVAVAGGAVAGGIFGGAWGGGKVWWQERKKVVGKSVLEKLKTISGGGPESEKWDVSIGIYAKTKEAYEKTLITGSVEELAEIGETLRAAKILMDRDAAGMENTSDKEKILAILKIAEDAETEIPLTKNLDKKELLELLKDISCWKGGVKFERGQIDWRKVARAAGRGALIGAVGGALGGAFASWMHGGAEGAAVHGGSGAPGEQVPMPGGGGAGAVPLEAGTAPADVAGGYMPHAAIADAVPPETLADRVVEIHNVYEQAMAPAREALLNHDFIATIHPGDGPTHAARNLLHDFLVNQNHLNPGAPTLSPEQLVWAEDTIYKNLLPNEDFYKLGHPPIHLSGDKLADVYSRALQLTPEKIQNLHQFVSGGRLSEKTLDYFADFKDLKEAGNNFWAGAQEQAEAAQKAYIENMRAGWGPHTPLVEAASLTPEEQLASLPPDYHPPGSMPDVAASGGELAPRTDIPMPGPEGALEPTPTPETGILDRVFGGETTGEGVKNALLTLGGVVAVGGGIYGYRWMRKVEKAEKEQKEGGDGREKTLTDEERLAEIKETFESDPALGDIYERASRKDAKFGEELTLDDEEKKKINTLMEEVMSNWQDRYLQATLKESDLETEWNSFVDLLAGNRDGLIDDEREKIGNGNFRIATSLDAKKVSHHTDEKGNLTLAVPDGISKLYTQYVAINRNLKDLADGLDNYDRKVANKEGAQFFAGTLRFLHELNEKFKV